MSNELEIEELRKSKDQAYWERNQLVAALSKLFPSWLSRHPDDDKNWENDWRWIVFIEIPTMEWTGIPDNRVNRTRQLSWHIHDSEFKHFSHLTMKENVWDGHSTEEKYRRLQLIAKSERYDETTRYVKVYTNVSDSEIAKSIAQSLSQRGIQSLLRKRHDETSTSEGEDKPEPDQSFKIYTDMNIVDVMKSIDEPLTGRLISEVLAERDRQAVMSEQRDTQFAALARSIIDEMLAQKEGRWIDFDMDDKDDIEEYALIIARRLYDLADSIKNEVYGSLESST